MYTFNRYTLMTLMVSCLLFMKSMGGAQTQNFPNSNIYLFSLEWQEGQMKISDPVWLSYFNENGYNNQPRFINDHEFLFTSSVGLQTDIFLGNLVTRELKNVTQSELYSEYSASLFRRDNSLRVVQVDQDNRQYLVDYQDFNSLKSKIVFEHIDNVGYYYNHTSDSIIVFRVDQPNQLWLYTLHDNRSKALSRNIGRCFGQYGRDQFLYTIKEGDRIVLRSMSPKSGLSEFVAFMPEGSEDFIVLYDRTVICAQAHKLLKLELGKVIGGFWREIFNFEPWGLNNVSRLAINPAQTLLIVTHTK